MCYNFLSTCCILSVGWDIACRWSPLLLDNMYANMSPVPLGVLALHCPVPALCLSLNRIIFIRLPKPSVKCQSTSGDLMCWIRTSGCRTCGTRAWESKHAVKNRGLYTWLRVDVLSSVDVVAMNDGVAPAVFGTTANDDAVSCGCWLSPLFFTQDLKPWGCRSMAVKDWKLEIVSV